MEIFNFSLLGGVKFCPREGDCVLRGQPMGIPPRTPPLAHVWPRPIGGRRVGSWEGGQTIFGRGGAIFGSTGEEQTSPV